MTIKRVQKSRVIASEIERQIRSGHLQPGDSLASVKSLCATYRAGQNTVERALRELEERRLIEIKARSGCYVLSPDQALDELTARRSAAARSVGRNAQPQGSLLDFMQPQIEPSDRITLYASELSERGIRTWREALDRFEGADVELLTCLDGRLEDVIRERPLDIVQSTPALLASMGADRFAPLTDAAPLDSQWWDQTLPTIRQRREMPDPLVGVPFVLTVPYLFVNLELAKKAGASTRPASPIELLKQARAAAPRMQQADAHAIAVPTLLDLLWSSGAISPDAQGRIVVDDAAAMSVFQQLHGSDVALTNAMDVVDAFRRGELMYLIHCSFEAPYFLANADFHWHAIPLPIAEGVRTKSWLTVLALSRTTDQPDLGMALIRHLTSPEIQAHFARDHGNLPVLRDLVPQVATDDAYVSEQTVTTALAQSTLSIPEHTWLHVSKRLQMVNDRTELVAGRLSPEEALEHLHWYASLAADEPQ